MREESPKQQTNKQNRFPNSKWKSTSRNSVKQKERNRTSVFCSRLAAAAAAACHFGGQRWAGRGRLISKHRREAAMLAAAVASRWTTLEVHCLHTFTKWEP